MKIQRRISTDTHLDLCLPTNVLVPRTLVRDSEWNSVHVTLHKVVRTVSMLRCHILLELTWSECNAHTTFSVALRRAVWVDTLLCYGVGIEGTLIG